MDKHKTNNKHNLQIPSIKVGLQFFIQLDLSRLIKSRMFILFPWKDPNFPKTITAIFVQIWQIICQIWKMTPTR